MIERYFLSQDGSCHWYVVPVSKQKEWSKWTDLDEDDEAAWDAPEWAYRIGGDPGMVEFLDPKIRGKSLFI